MYFDMSIFVHYFRLCHDLFCLCCYYFFNGVVKCCLSVFDKELLIYLLNNTWCGDWWFQTSSSAAADQVFVPDRQQSFTGQQQHAAVWGLRTRERRRRFPLHRLRFAGGIRLDLHVADGPRETTRGGFMSIEMWLIDNKFCT